MQLLCRSSSAQLTLGNLRGRETATSNVRRVLSQRITEALSEARYDIRNLEDLGRWTHQRIGSLIKAATPKLPQGVFIRGVIVTFYSEEDARGTVVMKVDCRTGRLEIY